MTPIIIVAHMIPSLTPEYERFPVIQQNAFHWKWHSFYFFFETKLYRQRNRSYENTTDMSVNICEWHLPPSENPPFEKPTLPATRPPIFFVC